MDRQRPATTCLPAAIAALSLSLPGSHVSPETFRLAKFDRPQASITFWKLLYSLLKQIHGGRWIESTDTGIQVRFVKYAALSYGYRRLKFYKLPSDGSEGSRELLLAFSWFLCRIVLMEKLLTLRRLKLWDETTVCMLLDKASHGIQNSKLVTHGLGCMTMKCKYGWIKNCTQRAVINGLSNWKCNPPLNHLRDVKNFPQKTHLEDQRDIQYLQWLNGRLRLQWRSYHMEQQEQCKLLYKVHSYTMGSHTDPIIGHFSVTEVDVGRQPDSYKQLLHFVESDCSRLDAFLKWKSMEPLYWHWMETVLDTETEEAQDYNMYHKDSLLPSINLGCYSISRITEELDRCRDALLSLCQELRELITFRKLGCYGKVGTKEEKQGESDFCRGVKKVQETVEQKLSGLIGSGNASRIRTLHGPYRLVLKQNCLKGGQPVAPNTAPAERITTSPVIRELKKHEARLKALLKQQQEEDRQKIHRAAKGLSRVLFIPPVKRQTAE